MQVHGGPQIDLSAQVALVKAKTRPWKSIIALVLAIGAAVTSGWAHSQFRHFFADDDYVHQIIAAATAVAFCVFASAATVGLSGKARSLLAPVMGAGHAAVVRYALVLIGAITTLVVTLGLFGVPIGQLLLGGALTSVFVGIAAQQALSNLFAGLVLLLARPFKVGESIRLRAGAMSGEIGGTVNEIGITYLKLGTLDGVLSIPNSLVLGAIVGPLPPGTRLPAPASPAPATATASGLMAATLPGTVSPPLSAAAVSVPPTTAPAAPGSPGMPVHPGVPVHPTVPVHPAAAGPADGAAPGPPQTADAGNGPYRPGAPGEH
jgi:Mechanosensitive ion channel